MMSQPYNSPLLPLNVRCKKKNAGLLVLKLTMIEEGTQRLKFQKTRMISYVVIDSIPKLKNKRLIKQQLLLLGLIVL